MFYLKHTLLVGKRDGKAPCLKKLVKFIFYIAVKDHFYGFYPQQIRNLDNEMVSSKKSGNFAQVKEEKVYLREIMTNEIKIDIFK